MLDGLAACPVMNHTRKLAASATGLPCMRHFFSFANSTSIHRLIPLFSALVEAHTVSGKPKHLFPATPAHSYPMDQYCITPPLR